MQTVNLFPFQISLAQVTVCLLDSDKWISLIEVLHFLLQKRKYICCG